MRTVVFDGRMDTYLSTVFPADRMALGGTTCIDGPASSDAGDLESLAEE